MICDECKIYKDDVRFNYNYACNLCVECIAKLNRNLKK